MNANTVEKSKGRILIVDDTPANLRLLMNMLVKQSYTVHPASEGELALKFVQTIVPDLILLDILMPGMDGFEVCRRLRADPYLSEAPILMLTSLDDLDSRLQGLEVGVDDFISKPFHRAELQARVRTITRLNRQRRLRALELQIERDRTRAILEALGEAVVVTDIEGIIQYFNPAAAALTGFSVEEALGQSWHLWDSKETEESLYCQIIEQIQSGQTWCGEVVYQRKDGSSYDAALTVAGLFASDPSERLVGFVSVQRDITPVKQAERAKDEFVSNVSHELRTPLSVITLISDNLDTLYNRLDDDKRRSMIQKIQKHTQILNELIEDVLEISRIDSGRISQVHERVCFSELAQKEVFELLLLANEKGQRLQLKVEQPLTVFGNPAQLGLVIRNLLTNAIKYTPNGGQINCECRLINTDSELNEADWPDFACLPPGRWAALRVVDNGVGIAAEHIPHLFDRFYRVQTQQTIRGTGLGLSIAQELINFHDGTITVSSVPGSGSIFAIYLPLMA